MSESAERSILLSNSKQRLPDNIVHNILNGLPVKSLIRFRCVSKFFNSTITNPKFITTHLNQPKSLSNNNNNNNTHNGYFLIQLTEELCTVVYNSDHTLTCVSSFEIPSAITSGYKIVASCNGSLCLVHYTTYPNNNIYLWNPSIKKLNLVPACPWLDRFLAASVILGLACDSQKTDLKILRLVSFDSFLEQPAEAEVYSLSTDSWRKLEIPVDSLYGSSVTYIFESPCLFFNGALHSVVYSDWVVNEVESLKFILSFNVDDESFRDIMLPQNYLPGGRECLAVFKGSLALISFAFTSAAADPSSGICHIWVMKEYGVFESWTQISVPMARDGHEMLLGCTVNGELLIKTLSSIVSLDPQSSKMETLTRLPHSYVIYTANFVESLVLLDG